MAIDTKSFCDLYVRIATRNFNEEIEVRTKTLIHGLVVTLGLPQDEVERIFVDEMHNLQSTGEKRQDIT